MASGAMGFSRGGKMVGGGVSGELMSPIASIAPSKIPVSSAIELAECTDAVSVVSPRAADLGGISTGGRGTAVERSCGFCGA